MGYRSDVYVAIRPDSYDDIDARMEQLKLLIATRFAHIHETFGFAKWDWSTRRLDIEIFDVKWYPSYAEVQDFEQFLEELVALGYCAQFVTVGGEYGAMSGREYGDVWDPMLSTRVIVERT